MNACCLQDLFNSAFEGFKYQGDFGLFKAEKNILFQVSIDQSHSVRMLLFAQSLSSQL